MILRTLISNLSSSLLNARGDLHLRGPPSQAIRDKYIIGSSPLSPHPSSLTSVLIPVISKTDTTRELWIVSSVRIRVCCCTALILILFSTTMSSHPRVLVFGAGSVGAVCESSRTPVPVQHKAPGYTFLCYTSKALPRLHRVTRC